VLEGDSGIVICIDNHLRPAVFNLVRGHVRGGPRASPDIHLILINKL